MVFLSVSSMIRLLFAPFYVIKIEYREKTMKTINWLHSSANFFRSRRKCCKNNENAEDFMKSPAFCFEMIESEAKTPCFTQILHLIGRLDTESDSQYRFCSRKKQYRQNPTVLRREDSQIECRCHCPQSCSPGTRF